MLIIIIIMIIIIIIIIIMDRASLGAQPNIVQTLDFFIYAHRAT